MRTIRDDVYPIAMPEIEITDECRALIATVVEFPAGRRMPNGNWQAEIDAVLWQRLQKVRRQGETISDCIIRVLIISLHKRGLQ